MRFFYDTEFIEDGRTIDLISIGVVAEDGRELYAVNRDAPWKRIAKREWLVDNVVPSLPRTHGNRRLPRGNPLAIDLRDPAVLSRRLIAREVRSFLLAASPPELWAWYGAYDHVVLAQLFGSMDRYPPGLPMWTNDVRQLAHRLGVESLEEDVPMRGEPHNALADARWVRDAYVHLMTRLRDFARTDL